MIPGKFLLFVSHRSQMTNISASCAPFLFLPHFDVICDLLLKRHMATWNLFVEQTTSFKASRESCEPRKKRQTAAKSAV